MKYIVDTGFLGIKAALAAKETLGEDLLAVTVSADCANYTDVLVAVLQAFSSEIVYAGAPRPTLRDALPTEKAPSTTTMVSAAGFTNTEYAANAISRIATECEEVAVICLGPLTNVALAIMKNPEVAQNLNKIIIAGGAQLGYGYVTETAEYNIYTDPEAADTVVKSGIPLVFVPPEACTDYRMGAVRYAIDNSVLTEGYEAFIDVDVSTSRTYGQTVVDPIGWNPINNQRHAGEKSFIVAKIKEEDTNA